jgi:hypothetical protein
MGYIWPPPGSFSKESYHFQEGRKPEMLFIALIEDYTDIEYSG